MRRCCCAVGFGAVFGLALFAILALVSEQFDTQLISI